MHHRACARRPRRRSLLRRSSLSEAAHQTTRTGGAGLHPRRVGHVHGRTALLSRDRSSCGSEGAGLRRSVRGSRRHPPRSRGSLRLVVGGGPRRTFARLQPRAAMAWRPSRLLHPPSQTLRAGTAHDTVRVVWSPRLTVCCPGSARLGRPHRGEGRWRRPADPGRVPEKGVRLVKEVDPSPLGRGRGGTCGR